MYDELSLQQFGERLGLRLRGGECIELVGDVGAGKTTLTKAIARSLGIDEQITSPTFTISNRYENSDGLTLIHYDFYRLADAGIIRNELAESIDDPKNITIVEWAGIVDDVLPEDRLTISIRTTTETERKLTFSGRTTLVEGIV